ncbi:MAG: diguanylate cyclase [Magnetococcales bacterium]|nr:diguanylate cyclase [Magnetococcales bacterium]
MKPQSVSKPIRILLVDDQALTGLLLRRMLGAEEEMAVLACLDPAAAVQMAEEQDPAVILLDLVMPGVDGLTLLRRFRSMERFSHTPIILLSSQEEAEWKAQAFQDGANDYLIKLPDAVEMVARLRYHAENYFNRQKHIKDQQALLESEQRFRMVTQSIPEAIVAVCPDGMIHFWNRGAEKIFGYTAQEIYDRSLTVLLPQHASMQPMRKLHRIRLYSQRYQEDAQKDRTWEMVGVRKGGETFPMEFSIATWKAEGVVHFAAVIRDITERKRAEEKIRHQAHFDLLTDLPNRNLFLKRLDESLALAARQSKRLALLFIDLDRFKWVNDTLGHEAGDDLLQQAAQRMLACVRKSDTVARLGGDEFTMILFDIADAVSVTRVVETILQQLAVPFLLSGQEVGISGSIGVTFFPEDGDGREALLRNADHAMYVAKRSGRNAYWLFQPEQQGA